MTTSEFFNPIKNMWSLKDVTKNFLEDLDKLSGVHLSEVLSSEPGVFDGNKNIRCYYSALIDYYCNKRGVSVPTWTQDEKYFLETIYKPFNTYKLDEYSLEEFKKKNIVVLKEDIE